MILQGGYETQDTFLYRLQSFFQRCLPKSISHVDKYMYMYYFLYIYGGSDYGSYLVYHGQAEAC